MIISIYLARIVRNCLAMSWIWVIIGIALVLLGLIDVFFTVLDYDGAGFITARLSRILWALVRTFAISLPGKARGSVLSLGGPLMIPLTLGFWILVEIFGFALLYYVGISESDFTFSQNLKPTFGNSLYLSAETLITLGFGDITPTAGRYRLLTVLEAGIGISLITMAISYVLKIYQALQELSTLSSDLHQQARTPGDPMSCLRPHFRNGHGRGLDHQLQRLYQELGSYYESLRRHHTAYYFHSRQSYRSIPYTLHMLGGLIAALNWGLPRSNAAAQEPLLPSLIAEFDTVQAFLNERFLPGQKEDSPDPVPFGLFVQVLSGEKELNNRWLNHFLHLDNEMRKLARPDAETDMAEIYSRYSEWLRFAHRTQETVKRVTHHLGYDLDELYQGGGRKPRNA